MDQSNGILITNNFFHILTAMHTKGVVESYSLYIIHAGDSFQADLYKTG